MAVSQYQFNAHDKLQRALHMAENLSLEERKVVYRARRGLKEIDVYFDPYVRQHYAQADAQEKALFAQLVAQEDPDLLDWFMQVSAPPSADLAEFIQKLKRYVHDQA